MAAASELRGNAFVPWLAGLALIGLAVVGASAFIAARPTPVIHETVAIERGHVARFVDATGTLMARGTVQVSTEISGRIANVAADFNAEVKEGQLLVQLAPEIYRARVAEAEAEFEFAEASLGVAGTRRDRLTAEEASARAKLAAAEAERESAEAMLVLARAEFLRRSAPGREQFVSGSDRDRARAEFDRANASRRAAEAEIHAQQAAVQVALAGQRTAEAEILVAQAVRRQRQAALDRARFDLHRTEIRAPISGIVIERNVEIGQTVAASLQAPILFTIARDLTEMQVEMFVDEADIGLLKEGQRVDFRVAAFPNRGFSGVIAQLRLAPLLIQNVVTYVAIITAANPDRQLRPGLTATVRAKVDERDNVMRVPNAALRFRPSRGERVERAAIAPSAGGTSRGATIVHVESGGALREVPVVVGLADDRFSEIRDGAIAPGDRLVTGYR